MACEMEFEITVHNNSNLIEKPVHLDYQKYHEVERLHACRLGYPSMTFQNSKHHLPTATWSGRNGKRRINLCSETSRTEGQSTSHWLNKALTNVTEPVKKRPYLECAPSDEKEAGNHPGTLGNLMDICRPAIKKCHRCEAGEGGHLGHISS